jgi:hypothetical protein
LSISAVAFLLLAFSGLSQAQEPGRLPTWLPGRPMPDAELVSPPQQKIIHFAREPQARQTTLEFTRPPVTPATFVDAAAQETPRYGRQEEGESEFQVTKELPGLDRLTRRESEKEFFNRIRQETRQRPGSERPLFPEETILTRETHAPRNFPAAHKLVEPCYVCHRRLVFEQPNFERYGYDFGFFQPAVSTAVTMFDLVTLPYQYCTRPTHQYDTSAGKCLPGDPVPMLLYPPEFSLTGLLGEAGASVGLLFAFP